MLKMAVTSKWLELEVNKHHFELWMVGPLLYRDKFEQFIAMNQYIAITLNNFFKCCYKCPIAMNWSKSTSYIAMNWSIDSWTNRQVHSYKKKKIFLANALYSTIEFNQFKAKKRFVCPFGRRLAIAV
jgi:hypothetical protein